ncbi:ABC transporter ATP-binding protein [Clostridium thermarum]|uniref:ABC transporter ATP-binding protein n=1 Tax=Clostridium thermarum TaxID=1716543 RepID=UPI00111FF440|nr:ABC transporter ATP-binding protein [Clostridium thermarum]
MLKVKNLVKNYGELNVLKNISFEVEKGKVYGFLGQNGAGKTTTMNILTGLINYDGGEIYLDGEKFDKNKRHLLKKVGYLPQSPVFYGYMTAYEYLNFIGELSGMSATKIKSKSAELIETMGLKDAAHRKIGGYSGGMKQRFGLAVSLFNDPELLILDEPTSALDPEGRAEILHLISNLKKRGLTVFLSTHILSDVERVCDEVSIIHKGEILISDNLNHLKNQYIQPVFDIEFENECSNLKEILCNIPWIQRVKIAERKASIYVTSLDHSKKDLFQILSEYDNTCISYNLRKSDLEDIFIRLVNNNGNI